MGVLLSVDEWDSKPEPAFEMDISDLAGLIEESWSVLPGSFRERCCRTLIIASFSMIWACRVLILFEKYKEQCTCTPVSLDWGLSAPMAVTRTPSGIWGGRERMPVSLLPWILAAHWPTRADHAWHFLYTCMRERHWDTHPPLATGSCSKQPRKGLWDKAESYGQCMTATERRGLTHFGEPALDLTPGKTVLWDC